MTEAPSLTLLLQRDLSSFADPAMPVSVERVDTEWFSARWMQDGQPRTARLRIDPSSTIPSKVEFGGRALSYRGFLASAEMADLRALARNTAYVIKAVQPYVSVQAALLDETDAPSDADELVTQMAQTGDDRTTLVFISADAGMGKTSVLRELVRRKADDYLLGNTEALWIYVDAQGRRLAQLDEALAAELDDLRARFPYHAAAALVRSGAMVLVVDGFDELIGSVGSYDEAFSSLADFIANLNGSGCLIAAARSSYYEQEFLTRANLTLSSAIGSWYLRGIRIVEWDSERRDTFVRQYAELHGKRGEAVAAVVRSVDEVLGSSGVSAVSGRPLFVSRTVEILLDSALPDGANLLDRLVSAYISREVNEKLRSPSGAPMLSSAQYREFLRELAEEMWKQESRELTRASVREIGRVVGEVMGIAENFLEEIVERLPYAALLTLGSSPGAVAFEHEIFYSYFLADPVAVMWNTRDGRALSRLLRRGRLPEEAASLVAGRIDKGDIQGLLDSLYAAMNSLEVDREQVRRNAGNLAAAVLHNAKASDLHIKSLVFGDMPFGQCVLQGSTFTSCSFTGTDLSSTKFVSCSGQDATFDRVVVDSSTTVLDISGVGIENFFGLTTREGGGERLIFVPLQIVEVLSQCGLPAAGRETSYPPVDSQVVALLDRLCRLFLKTNAITEDDDNAMVPIARSELWPGIRKALLDSGVVSLQTKSASGRKIFLRRHARPQDIMAGADARAEVPANVRSFWRILVDRYPSS